MPPGIKGGLTMSKASFSPFCHMPPALSFCFSCTFLHFPTRPLPQCMCFAHFWVLAACQPLPKARCRVWRKQPACLPHWSSTSKSLENFAFQEPRVLLLSWNHWEQEVGWAGMFLFSPPCSGDTLGGSKVLVRCGSSEADFLSVGFFLVGLLVE